MPQGLDQVDRRKTQLPLNAAVEERQTPLANAIKAIQEKRKFDRAKNSPVIPAVSDATVGNSPSLDVQDKVLVEEKEKQVKYQEILSQEGYKEPIQQWEKKGCKYFDDALNILQKNAPPEQMVVIKKEIHHYKQIFLTKIRERLSEIKDSQEHAKTRNQYIEAVKEQFIADYVAKKLSTKEKRVSTEQALTMLEPPIEAPSFFSNLFSNIRKAIAGIGSSFSDKKNGTKDIDPRIQTDYLISGVDNVEAAFLQEKMVTVVNIENFVHESEKEREALYSRTDEIEQDIREAEALTPEEFEQLAKADATVGTQATPVVIVHCNNSDLRAEGQEPPQATLLGQRS